MTAYILIAVGLVVIASVYAIAKSKRKHKKTLRSDIYPLW